MKPRVVLLLILIPGLVPILLSLQHGFYLDDFAWLERAHLTTSSPSKILASWTHMFVRPVGQAYFFVQYLLFGLHSWAYNLLGLILHLFAGFLAWRVAVRVGLPRPAAAITAAFFLSGFWHYCKPVLWICSHTMMLGTLFALAAAGSLLAPASGGRFGEKAPFPTIALLLSAAAMLSHDLLVSAPIALALLAWSGGHPRARTITWVSVLIVGGYLLVSMSVHGRLLDTGQYRLGPHIFFNAVFYLASLVGPVHSFKAFRDTGRALGAPAPLLQYAPIGLVIAFALAVACVLALPRRRARVEYGLLGAACLFLLPALPVSYPVGWVDVRYTYPASAFAAIALPFAFVSLFRRSGGRRILVVSMLVVVYVGILAGSFYQSRKAICQGRDPKNLERRAHIEAIVGGGSDRD